MFKLRLPRAASLVLIASVTTLPVAPVAAAPADRLSIVSSTRAGAATHGERLSGRTAIFAAAGAATAIGIVLLILHSGPDDMPQPAPSPVSP